MGKRVEEGLAILIKSNLFQQLKNNASEKNKDNDLLHSLHVSNIQTLFLPRNFEDSRFFNKFFLLLSLSLLLLYYNYLITNFKL